MGPCVRDKVIVRQCWIIIQRSYVRHHRRREMGKPEILYLGRLSEGGDGGMTSYAESKL